MNHTARKIGAAFGLAAIAGLTVALPASAATTGEWGTWSGGADSFDYDLTYTDPAFIGAGLDYSDVDYIDIYSPSSEEEGFTIDDPLGALIGANVVSTDELFLKIETFADNSVAANVNITFDSPVPAGQLVLALSDIDSDWSRITMTNAEGENLTGDEIIGSATQTGFNWAEPSSATDIPVVEAYELEAVRMFDAPDGTDGSTGWIRPSDSVATVSIQIYTEDNNVSSQRLWIGQVIEAVEDNTEALADTGASDSLYMAAAAGGALVALGGLVAVRRRQA